MQIEFINITTYKGISSDAEHFYASVGKPDMVQEFLLTDPVSKPESGVFFGSEDLLRHFPSPEEAEAMWQKDHGHDRVTDKWHDEQVQSIVKDGTIRFPSILTIVRAARGRFPDAKLCFCFRGSRKEFVRILQFEMQKHPELMDEIEDLIKSKNK